MKSALSRFRQQRRYGLPSGEPFGVPAPRSHEDKLRGNDGREPRDYICNFGEALETERD